MAATESDEASQNLDVSETFYSKSGIEIVTNPFLVGEPLMKKALQTSIDFVNHWSSKDSDILNRNICVLDILMGGRYYQLYNAFQQALPEGSVTHAEVRAKRRFEDDKWKVNVWHDTEASTMDENTANTNLINCDTLVIGDTVATGTTLTGVISRVLERLPSEKKIDVIIYCICGGNKCEEKLKKIKPLVKSLSVYYANAKFLLNENGTDLGFVNAEFHEDSKKEIDDLIGDFAANMKCAIWDWGDRFTKINHHMEEINEYYDKFDSDIVPTCITRNT